MRIGKVLDRLLQFGPTTIGGLHDPPRCILATAVTIDTLALFDIEAAPLPVDVWCLNPAARDLTDEDNHDVDAWLRFGAFTLSTDGRGDILTDFPGPKWVGHLIAHVPGHGFAIDLDLRALSRPARHLVLPLAAAIAWPAGGPESAIDIGACRVRYRVRPDDTAWTAARDWTAADKRQPIVQRLARAIRKGSV